MELIYLVKTDEQNIAFAIQKKRLQNVILQYYLYHDIRLIFE